MVLPSSPLPPCKCSFGARLSACHPVLVSPGFARTVFALIIINKAGGLIYNKNFHDGLNKISTNDYLVLAGTFHGYIPPQAPGPLIANLFN